MEAAENYWKLAAGDPRSQVYGGKFYGSISWIPANMLMKKQPEFAAEYDQGSGGETSTINRLPDDIVHQVFDKIPDSKNLCNCSLVSKNFASRVLDRKRVSLEIQSWRPVCSCHQDPAIRRLPFFSLLGELLKFLIKPFNYVWWLLRNPFKKPELHYPDVITFKPPAIKNFLKKFSCIESLTIDLSFSGVMRKTPRFEPLVRWKCDTSGFIFVSAKSRDLLFDDDSEEALGDAENAIDWTRAEAYAELDSVQHHFMDAVWRLVFVESILEDFPSLKNILVTDCLNQGRVILDEDELLRVRDSHKPLEDEISCCVKVWHMPVVKLPLSGFIVREATLCVYKEVSTDDDVLVENAFEEKLYSELARTMVAKASFHHINISASEIDGRFRFVIG